MNNFTLDLKKYNISRPQKVVWRLQNKTLDISSIIRSKSLRKFLIHSDEVLKKNAITYEYKEVLESDFLIWLKYYQTKMEDNEYEIIASKEWYTDRVAKGLRIEGVFFYKDTILVGSGIFTRQKNDKATFAFKASDRLSLSSQTNSSLGSIIDYLFISEMVKQNVEVISGGKSGNLFGVHNTYGYIDYKLKLGYTPYISEELELSDVAETSENGSVAFFGLQNEKVKLFFFRPNDLSFDPHLCTYLPDGIEYVEIVY